VCHIPAQRQQLLQDSRASADMIKVTAMPPDARRREIQSMVQKHVVTDKNHKQFKLDVSSQMAAVRGRVLKPPNVFYARDQFLSPQKGAWNLVNHVLRTPSPRWGLSQSMSPGCKDHRIYVAKLENAIAQVILDVV